jgi:hypothetical protein
MAIADKIEKAKGKMIRIEISLYRKRRTDAQSGYYRSVILPTVTKALRSFGNPYDEAETHAFLKGVVGKLGKIAWDSKGNPVPYLPSSEDIDRDGWSEWFELIFAWAAQQGIEIPPPRIKLRND